MGLLAVSTLSSELGAGFADSLPSPSIGGHSSLTSQLH